MANESVFGNPSIGMGQQHYGWLSLLPELQQKHITDYPNPLYTNLNGTNRQDEQIGIPQSSQNHGATRNDWQSRLPHSMQSNFDATSQNSAHQWLPQVTVGYTSLHSGSRHDYSTFFEDELRERRWPSRDSRYETEPCAACHPLHDRNRDLSSLRFLDYIREKPIKTEREVLEDAARIAARLPERISIQLTKDKVSGLSQASCATDFLKLAYMFCPERLNDEACKVLKEIKSISLSNGRFTVELAVPLKFGCSVKSDRRPQEKMEFGHVEVGTDKDPRITFKVKRQSKDDGGIEISDIKGVSFETPAGRVPFTRVVLHGDGACTLTSSLFPGCEVSRRIAVPTALQGVDPKRLSEAITTFDDLRNVVETKDISRFTNSIQQEEVRNAVCNFIAGLTSIEKDGTTYKVRQEHGRINCSFGAARVSVMPDIKFNFDANPHAPSVEDVSGVNFSLFLPPRLGLGKFYDISIKSVELGKRCDGQSLVTVKTDEADAVQFRLGDDLRPAGDLDGNWMLRLRGSNPLCDDKRMMATVNLRMGANMRPNPTFGQGAEIVSHLSWQARDWTLAGASYAEWSALTKLVSLIFD